MFVFCNTFLVYFEVEKKEKKEEEKEILFFGTVSLTLSLSRSLLDIHISRFVFFFISFSVNK